MASFALTNVADNAQMSIAYASNTTQKLPNSADIRIDAPSGLFGFDAVMCTYPTRGDLAPPGVTVRGKMGAQQSHGNFHFPFGWTRHFSTTPLCRENVLTFAFLSI